MLLRPEGTLLAHQWVPAMFSGRLSLSLTVAGLATLCAASLLVWLVLYEPVAVATAVDEGSLVPIFQLIGYTLTRAARAIVRYL